MTDPAAERDPTAVRVVVPNVGDFNVRDPMLALDPATRRGFAHRALALSDQAVFWARSPRVLVLPDGVDREWLRDVCRDLGDEQPAVVSPRPCTGFLLEDLMADGDALAALRACLPEASGVDLLTWGASAAVYRLAATIEAFGHPVRLDCTGRDAYWSTLYLDSKDCCPELAAAVPGLRTVPGIAVDQWTQVDGALDVVLGRSERAIVKSMHGVGGDGSVVVRPGPTAREGFWLAVNRDPLMRGRLSVQDYLVHDPRAGCPALDLVVGAQGLAGTPVLSRMTVESGHRFRRVAVGTGSLPPELVEPLLRLADGIARHAAALGYRGWLCVDCLLSTDGTLYVTELNARRSGAMHSIALVGEDGLTTRATCADETVRVRLEGGRVCYADVLRVVAEARASGAEVYVTSVRGLRDRHQTVGLVTVADSAPEAGDLMDRLGRRLDPIGPGQS